MFNKVANFAKMHVKYMSEFHDNYDKTIKIND